MNLEQPTESEALTPLHVVMIFLVTAVLGGGFLLLSAGESTTLVDGAVEWQAESPLRAVVQLLCLDYRFPTLNAGDVKEYLLGIGAGLGLLALSFTLFASGTGTDADEAAWPSEQRRLTHLSPLVVAQLLAVFYVLWSFASSRWSPSPRISVGGSILLGVGILWALCVAYGMSPRAARITARLLVVITGLSAAVAIWYYYGRNPTLRAKFPFGNPNFLAAALVPGILLALAEAIGLFSAWVRSRGPTVILGGVLCLVALGVSVWALSLTSSRAAILGLAVGALAMSFFALPGRGKWLPVVLCGAAIVVGAWYFTAVMDQPSPTGRNVTLRLRTYAWSYAWRMFTERPVTGYGQGGFAMLGDSYARDDVLKDPPVFESRIDHAHGEWLEVMGDLGAVGILLLAAAVILTIRAAWESAEPKGEPVGRATRVGLLGALVAFVVEESFGVGLRVCELPVVFYTVWGLLWASARPREGLPWTQLVLTRRTRPVLGLAGVVVAAAAMVVTQHDFEAARNAFRTDELLQKGEQESAARLAALATDRLSPQRVLVNLYRLGQVHTIAAERLQERAAERDRRARETEPVNPRLLALVAEDVQAAEEHCRGANHALKNLVSASPGYLGHGQLEFRINLLESRTAGWRGETEAAQAYLRNAAAALERELLRQPFDPNPAADFVRLAGTQLDADTALTVLARPLRYNRITDAYFGLLYNLVRRDDVDRILKELALDPSTGQADEKLKPWHAERLRLAATADFTRGDYDTAVRKLERATESYATAAVQDALGVASGFAELADCRFYANPEHPEAAISSAQQAIEHAPESRPGRELRTAVRQRLVHYHLAKGEEVQARAILRELAPPSMQPELVDQELGVRYRRLCESLIQRREAMTFRKPAESLLPKLQQWCRRALELTPGDAAAHLLAADLAFYSHDDEASAGHLGDALRVGLAPPEAAKFLDMALEKRPDSAALRKLREALAAPGPEPPTQPAP